MYRKVLLLTMLITLAYVPCSNGVGFSSPTLSGNQNTYQLPPLSSGSGVPEEHGTSVGLETTGFPDVDKTLDAETVLRNTLSDYIFGETKDSLKGEELKIYEWELARWQGLQKEGKSIDEICHMIELRDQLKPMVQAYHFFVIPDNPSLIDWIGYVDTMERFVSMIEEEETFLVDGARLEEVGYKESYTGSRNNNELDVDYNLNQRIAGYLNVKILPEAEDFTKYDTVQFLVKGDVNEIRLQLQYLDETGNAQTVGDREGIFLTELIPGLKIKPDEWALVEIPISTLMEKYPDADFKRIETFRLHILADDIDLDAPTEGKISLKDIMFTFKTTLPEGEPVQTIADVKQVIQQRYEKKEQLQNRIHRPLILSTLEDRMMLKDFAETGNFTQWQSDESMLAFLDAYYGRFLNADEIPEPDEGIVNYYTTQTELVGMNKVKDILAKGMVIRPFVEGITGKLRTERSEDAGVLTAILEGMFEDSDDARRGGFMWWRSIWQGIKSLAGAGVTDMDILRDMTMELKFASQLRGIVENALVGRILDVKAPQGDDIGFIMGYAVEARDRFGGVKDLSQAAYDMQNAIINGDTSAVAEIESKLNEALDKVDNKIKLFSRLLNLHMRGAGYTIDPASQTALYDEFLKNRFKPDMRYMTEENELAPVRLRYPVADIVQWVQDFSVEHQLPLETMVLFGMLPKVSTEEGNALALRYNPGNTFGMPVLLNDWRTSNVIDLNLKTEKPGSDKFRLVINDSEGNQTIFEIEGVSSNWGRLTIPIWGPLSVNWVDENDPEYLSNETWKDMLLNSFFWSENNDGSYSLRNGEIQGISDDFRVTLVSSNINDWSKIASIGFDFSNSITDNTLLISGDFYGINSYIGMIHVEDNIGRLKTLLESGPLMIGSDEGISKVIISDIRGNKIYYVDPSINRRKTSSTIDDFISKYGGWLYIYSLFEYGKGGM